MLIPSKIETFGDHLSSFFDEFISAQKFVSVLSAIDLSLISLDKLEDLHTISSANRQISNAENYFPFPTLKIPDSKLCSVALVKISTTSSTYI